MSEIAPAIQLHRAGEPNALAVGRIVHYPVRSKPPAAAEPGGTVGLFADVDAGLLDGAQLGVQVVDTGAWLKPQGSLTWASDENLAILALSDPNTGTSVPKRYPLVAFDDEVTFSALVKEAQKAPGTADAEIFTTRRGGDRRITSAKLVPGSAEAIKQGVLNPKRMDAALGVRGIQRLSVAPPSEMVTAVTVTTESSQYVEVDRGIDGLAFTSGIWCWFFRWSD